MGTGGRGSVYGKDYGHLHIRGEKNDAGGKREKQAASTPYVGSERKATQKGKEDGPSTNKKKENVNTSEKGGKDRHNVQESGDLNRYKDWGRKLDSPRKRMEDRQERGRRLDTWKIGTGRVSQDLSPIVAGR